MKAAELEAEVNEFRKNHAPEMSVQDAFPAWYLHKRFGLAPDVAKAQSSDPALRGSTKGDHGLDAFAIEPVRESETRLHLLQAKYSSDKRLIEKGVRELGRSLKHVAAEFAGAPGLGIHNKLYFNLRAAIQSGELSATDAPQLELTILHNSDAPEHEIRVACTRAISDLKEDFLATFKDAPKCVIRLIGPGNIGGDEVVSTQSLWTPLNMDASAVEAPSADTTSHMYLGIGHLADVVKMYAQRRQDLFAKNVRFFLRGRKALERGPAGKIQDSLRKACVISYPDDRMAELFAFMHNGITVFAKEVRVKNGRIDAVREPYVLNGCQTIKTAFQFRAESRNQDRIDEARWNRIRVPLRIITTRDEDLIRRITESNNRQNAIDASALRANDRVQVELQDQFRQAGIFYERQRGALAEAEEVSVALLQEEYPNSNQMAIEVENLARVLAATAEEFSYARSPSHIFEYDEPYQRVFSKKRLRSTMLLVFLDNVSRLLPLVLKKDLNLERESHGPSPARTSWYALSLLMQYLACNPDVGRRLVETYGTSLVPYGAKDLRDDLQLQLGNYKSKIKMALAKHFMTLDDSKETSLKAAYEASMRTLHLNKGRRDVFEVLGIASEA